MKKLLFSIVASTCLLSSLSAQDANFDKKIRFGLRITPQPTWFISDDKNNVPNGAKFGFGFGLNMEFKLSEIASLLTGIGGDLEGGKYQFRNDPGKYQAIYLMNENNEFVKPNGTTDGTNNKIYKSSTAFILKSRSVTTTYLTVPLILKLSTKEFSGLKYYGMFGAEFGFRLSAKATDTYFQTGKFYQTSSPDTIMIFKPIPGVDSQSGIDISKEFSGFPARVCFNAGLGAQYRLSGSTAVFCNVNYFRSLSNIMRKQSDYTFYKTEPSTGKSTFITQNLKLSGIRISVGVMF